ncbi:hypothetical protein Bca4012_089917 [Brassica carinata]
MIGRNSPLLSLSLINLIRSDSESNAITTGLSSPLLCCASLTLNRPSESMTQSVEGKDAIQQQQQQVQKGHSSASRNAEERVLISEPHQQRPGGGGRRPGGIQQFQQQPPMMQHQMHPRGRNILYSQGRGVSGGDVPPYDMVNNNMPLPIGALASNLANTSPEQQRTMLGDNLYPLVEKLEVESAAKVTGMLLEMDQTEVLHLLASPEALEAKVVEAMDVLRSVAAGELREEEADVEAVAAGSFSPELMHGDDRSAFKVHT